MSRAEGVLLKRHLSSVLSCSDCSDMSCQAVVGPAVLSEVMIVGQAPGPREASFGKPFAWTAGKTLFSWFERIGLNEESVRGTVFISAVCRCFPGKAPGGGDRLPTKAEVERCSRYLKYEISLLKPKLIIPVGRLAISQFVKLKPLNDLIGQKLKSAEYPGIDLIPLPHPSGVSTWHKKDPGASLLLEALELISRHPAVKLIKKARLPVVV